LTLDPAADSGVALKAPTPQISLVAKALSWLAIVMEAMAGMLLLIKRNHAVSHILLILTIISVFIFRPETGFLSLLATMGLLLAPRNFYRVIYLILVAFFTLMMATGLGLR
jgi:hypothetical protein